MGRSDDKGSHLRGFRDQVRSKTTAPPPEAAIDFKSDTDLFIGLLL
jgi:hypothetical protein